MRLALVVKTVGEHTKSMLRVVYEVNPESHAENLDLAHTHVICPVLTVMTHD